jgi:hypothetical protein
MAEREVRVRLDLRQERPRDARATLATSGSWRGKTSRRERIAASEDLHRFIGAGLRRPRSSAPLAFARRWGRARGKGAARPLWTPGARRDARGWGRARQDQRNAFGARRHGEATFPSRFCCSSVAGGQGSDEGVGSAHVCTRNGRRGSRGRSRRGAPLCICALALPGPAPARSRRGGHAQPRAARAHRAVHPLSAGRDAGGRSRRAGPCGWTRLASAPASRPA